MTTARQARKNGHAPTPVLHDNGEPLVRLVKDPLFWYQDYTPLTLPWLGRQHFLREGAVERLHKAARALSLTHERRYGLWIFETYVPAQMLTPFRQLVREVLRLRNPGWSKDKLEETWRNVSPPVDLSPAHTGGALGVTLFDRKTRETLWFGTQPTQLALGHVPNQDGLSHEQEVLYGTVKQAFLEAGFCSNPHKWWQFSTGDLMWARETGLEEAVYGPFPMALPVLLNPRKPLPYLAP